MPFSDIQRRDQLQLGLEKAGSGRDEDRIQALEMAISSMKRRDQGQQELEKGVEALKLAFEEHLRKRDEDQQKLAARIDMLALTQDTQATTMLYS